MLDDRFWQGVDVNDPGHVNVVRDRIKQSVAESDRRTYWVIKDILTHDPEFYTPGQIKLCWNSLTERMELHQSTLAKDLVPNSGEIYNRIGVCGRIVLWLASMYQVRVKHIRSVAAPLLRAARTHSYDPVKTYLNGLVGKWDGRHRLAHLFFEYAPAETRSKSGRDMTSLLRTYGLKWPISAVARALQPGCKVDHMLILEGKWGMGKKSFFDVMGGRYTTTHTGSIRTRKAARATVTSWLLRVSLNSIPSKDALSLRSFTSGQEEYLLDRRSKRLCKRERHAVLCSTSDKISGYLPGKSSRRYWIVRLKSAVALERLQEDRDQLWAEAVHHFNQGTNGGRAEPGHDSFLWWPTHDEEMAIQQESALRLK